MTDELKPVAWMYELAGARFTNLDGSKSYTNWKSRITTVYPNVPVDGLRNLTALYTADQLEALQQRVRELEEALQPFVRSCAWVEADDYPIRISNDHTFSSFDLLPEEVECARKALGDTHD